MLKFINVRVLKKLKKLKKVYMNKSENIGNLVLIKKYQAIPELETFNKRS